jgi:hypothetical protein
MSDVTKALQSLAPGASWVLDGSEIVWEEDVNSPGEFIATNFSWYSPEVEMPTREQLDNETARLQAEYDSREYQRLRHFEYPPLADLADALYWQANGDESKMTAYLAAVAAVKNKYPKGTA